MSDQRHGGMLSRLGWSLLGLAGSLVVRAAFSTVLGRETGLGNVREGRETGPGPVVFAIWHARLLGNCYNNRDQGVCVMISRHRDGEIIARIVERLGFVTARGSATRGAAPALRAMLRELRRGRDLALTVDGPRGPRHRVKPGAVYAAARSGCPIIPASVGYSRRHEFASWDRFQFPLPFGRMVVAYGPPVGVPSEAGQDEIDQACGRLAGELHRLSRLCDNLAAPVERASGSRMSEMLASFLMRGRNRVRHLPLLIPLLPLEGLYRLAWRFRELLHERGLARSWKPPVPVVCAGSLHAGGAGKTPLAALLARRLAGRGLRVAILSRGYGGERSSRRPVALAPGEVYDHDPAYLAGQIGDEPALLARMVPEAAVVVGGDRLASARAAIGRFDPGVLVLDDGFGHRRLARDMDILAITPRLAGTTGHTLPAGYLREPRRAAARSAAFAMIHNAPDDRSAEPREITWAAGKPVLRFSRAVNGLVRLEHWRQKDGSAGLLDPGTLRGKEVIAFCALASPKSFRETVAALDPGGLRMLSFGDHHRYSAWEQRRLRERAGECGAVLVTTEKDAVKLDPSLVGPETLVLCTGLSEGNPGELDRLLDELLRPGG